MRCLRIWFIFKKLCILTLKIGKNQKKLTLYRVEMNEAHWTFRGLVWKYKSHSNSIFDFCRDSVSSLLAGFLGAQEYILLSANTTPFWVYSVTERSSAHKEN